MFKGYSQTRLFTLSIMLTLIMVACQTTATPEEIMETPTLTHVVEETAAEVVQEATPTPVEVVEQVTPTPEPVEPRTLVICQGQEPDTLYPYAGSMLAKSHVLEAISEGSWGMYDTNSFAYQAVILEKLPNLADGDATVAVVTVSEGDTVQEAGGEVVVLDAAADPPIKLMPAGGGDPVAYEGGDFEMDQLSATFVLLPDLMWSDGTPMTAADSVYAFNLVADPDTPQQKYAEPRTASFEASDDLTTVWTGVPGFLDSTYFLNFWGPAPEHVWGQYTAVELIEAEESARAPLGWGAYVIDEWVQGDSVTLHKNPNYFRADEGLPVFDTVVYRFIGIDSNANIAALLSGECDILSQLTGLDDEMERVLELHNSGELNATFTTGTVWSHIDFGIQPVDYDDGYQEGVDRPDFFSDVRTRRAFAMCMDRQAMVDYFTLSQSIVIDTYLPPHHPLYNPEVIHYEFDVPAGSFLLEEVGWLDHDGDPTTPRIASNVKNAVDGTEMIVDFAGLEEGLAPQAIAIFQESLSECGIQADAQYYSAEEFYGDGPGGVIFGRNYDLGIFAWLTGVDPPCDLYLSPKTPGPAGETWISIQDGQERTFGPGGWGDANNTGFANDEYDVACNTALGSLPGQPEYKAAHLEAQRIFAEQLPVVPLYLQIKLAATRPDMCGFIMDPTANSEFWNIEEFDYGEGCEE